MLAVQQAAVRPHASSFGGDEEPGCPDHPVPHAEKQLASPLPLSRDFDEASTRTPSPTWSTKSMTGGFFDREISSSAPARLSSLSFDEHEDATPCDSCFNIPVCIYKADRETDALASNLSQQSTQASTRMSSKTKGNPDRLGSVEDDVSRELLLRKLEACALPARPEAASFDFDDASFDDSSQPETEETFAYQDDEDDEDVGECRAAPNLLRPVLPEEEPTQMCGKSYIAEGVDTSVCTAASCGDLVEAQRPEALGLSESCRARRRDIEQQKQSMLKTFLSSHKFTGVDEPRTGGKWFWSSTETVYPIHVAAQTGSYEIVRMLMAAGANPRQKTSRLRSAVDFAREAQNQEQSQNIIDLLQGRITIMRTRDLLALV